VISDWKLPDDVSILPSGWRLWRIRRGIQRHYVNDRRRLSVLAGMENHDGKWWLHISCVQEERMPTWEEFKEIKQIFIGRDNKAIQVLPNEKEYVNMDPRCLHLFHCPNDGLPDFTHEGGL
jgi:hypothetical protein